MCLGVFFTLCFLFLAMPIFSLLPFFVFFMLLQLSPSLEAAAIILEYNKNNPLCLLECGFSTPQAFYLGLHKILGLKNTVFPCSNSFGFFSS